MADRNVQMPEGYRPDDMLGNVVDCLCDRLDDAGLITNYDDRQASLAETCRLLADALGDGDYDSAGDTIWARLGPVLDRIGYEVAQNAGAPAVDPHEFDHSWTDDGTGHCQTCGAPSADQEAAQPQPLRFYDVARQPYADTVPVEDAGEFMIGDYDDGGVGKDGEFKIFLRDLGTGRHTLSPQVCAYGDATGALRRAIDTGLLDAIAADVADSDEFSRRLLALGFIDKSHRPLADEEGR
jgi:hypothetical protein